MRGGRTLGIDKKKKGRGLVVVSRGGGNPKSLELRNCQDKYIGS